MIKTKKLHQKVCFMLLSGGGRMEYGEYYKSFDPEPYYRERGWLIGSGKVGGKGKRPELCS